MIMTTSWDDGDALDGRVADMLDRFGVKGTFYIARDYRKKRVSDDMIRRIAKRHEIGSHTLTHPNLMMLSREAKRREIEGSKNWLEDITGKPVEMFCYPGGKCDEETINVVREAGYFGARTTEKKLPQPFDPYRLSVSLTFYPNPFTRWDYFCTGYRRLVAPVTNLLPPALSGESWQSHKNLEQRALGLFEEARKKNGIFHLYGHSWANTRYGLWPVLENVLRAIGGKQDCRYLTNAEVVRFLQTTKKPSSYSANL